MSRDRAVMGRWFFREVPARRLGLLRILIGGYALAYVTIAGRHLASFGRFDPDRFEPVGVATVLGEPLSRSLATWLVVATIVAGAAFVAGWRYRLSGPAFALLLLWVTTYRNSWGTVLHTENLMVLHVAILGFVVRSADAFSLDSRRRNGRGIGPGWAYGWPIRLMVVVTVLTYFVGGWAKVRNGGMEWVTGDVLRNQIAFDNLRKVVLGDPHSPLGGWAVQFGWIFPPMALGSMVIELGAPLAALSDRLGRLWAVAALSFHMGILALMAILFPYQLLGFAFLPFFPVERWFDRARSAPWLARIRRGAGVTAAPG